MADVNSWRRHTQLARPTHNTHISHSQIEDGAPPDDTSYSTSPGAHGSKLLSRSGRTFASFASSLGTHRPTVPPGNRPELFDWSNLNSLNKEDSIYEPNIELMCTTIMQQVLANPSADLLAQYNTFLLHLIEAYYQSKADVHDLKMKLAKETGYNQSTAPGFCGAILEKAPILQSLESEKSNTLHATRPFEEAITPRLRKHNPRFKTPKSSIDYGTSDQKLRQAEKTRTLKRQQLMSPARRYRAPSTVTTGVGSSHDHQPPSPLYHGIKLIDCDASGAKSEGERHRVLMSALDTVSILEDDIASRLSVWLALRLQCEPSEIFPEMSELLRSTQREVQELLAPSTIGILRPSMPKASNHITCSGKNQILQGQSNELIETRGSISPQSIRNIGHRQGFSFLPGDDSAKPILSDAFRGQSVDSETISIRPLAWHETKQSRFDDPDGSDESAPNDLSGGMTVGSNSQQRLTKSVVSSTASLGVSNDPQRDGPRKSVLIPVISTSSRSPSLSHRGSLNSNAEDDGLRESSSRPGNRSLAVAAARAAKNGTANGRIVHRQSS